MTAISVTTSSTGDDYRYFLLICTFLFDSRISKSPFLSLLFPPRTDIAEPILLGGHMQKILHRLQHSKLAFTASRNEEEVFSPFERRKNPAF